MNQPSITISNVKRQATHAMRGFDYQVLQSALAWVGLKEDELLLLEIAEDHDVLQGNTINSNQVKATSTPVSLNSKSVIDAINNFWALKNSNKEFSVYFRFLTTSERSHEEDFTEGEKGLDYWDKIKQNSVDLFPVKSFLLRHSHIHESIKHFILESTDNIIHEELINRMSWDTGAPTADTIIQSLQRRVREDCLRIYNAPPFDSEKVYPYLYERIWRTITDKNSSRSLTLKDYYDVVEEVLMTKMLSSEVRTLQSIALLENLSSQHFSSLVKGSENKEDLKLGRTIQKGFFEDLFLEPIASKRQLQTERLLNILEKNRLLVLQGSTGMGKSTLAELTAESSGLQWKVLKLRGLSNERISLLLDQITDYLKNEHYVPNIIIDDLGSPDQLRSYDDALVKCIILCLIHDSKVIITMQGNLPHKVVRSLGSEVEIIRVPMFTEYEIQELINHMGCPENMQAQWVSYINYKTRGHPQIAHSIAINAEIFNWNGTDEYIKGESQSLDAVYSDTWRILDAQLPNPEVKSLAYRLSIFKGSFRIEQVVAIAQTIPLQNPQSSLQILIGPWIERESKTYYQTSPLLYNCAENNFDSKTIKELHEVAAGSYYKQESVTTSDLSNLLYHSLMGEAIRPLIPLLHYLRELDDAKLSEAAKFFTWFIYYNTENDSFIFKLDIFTSVLLRLLQFQFARKLNSPNTVKILSLLEKETLHLSDYHRVLRLQTLLFVLQAKEIPISIQKARDILFEYLQLSENLKSEDKSGILNADTNIHRTLFSMFFERFIELKEFEEFINYLFLANEQFLQKLSYVIETDSWVIRWWIANIWFRETEKPSPDLEKCINLLEKLIVAAQFTRIKGIIEYTTRAILVICSEYLHDTERAQDVYLEAKSKGISDPIIDEYFARIAQQQNKHSDALAIWEKLLPNWEVELYDTDYIFSCNFAIRSAVELKRFDKIALFTQLGEKAASESNLQVWSIAFRADYSLMLWVTGKQSDSLSAFSDIIEKLEAISKLDSRLLTLRRKIGHVIT